MRYLIRGGEVAVLVAVFLSAAGTTVAAPDQPPPSSPGEEKGLADELQGLREHVRLLTERLEKAEQRIAELEKPPKEEVGGFGLPEGWEAKGPDRKALGLIKLPDNATREQVEAYVDEILDASRGQNQFSDSDPQVRMLAAVGAKHADVLIDRVGAPGDNYLVSALQRVVADEHRDLVIGALRNHPELVRVVRDRGWEAEAKDTLVKLLERRPPYLPPGVVEAVASYEDEKTYPLLLQQLAKGMNPESTYLAISGLPGIELDDAVGKAWARIRRGGDWPGAAMRDFELAGFAPVAAAHGHRDALDVLADILRKPGRGIMHDFQRQPARQGLLVVIEFEGDDDDALLRWLDENKGALRWDKTRRKFVLPPGEVG